MEESAPVCVFVSYAWGYRNEAVFSMAQQIDNVFKNTWLDFSNLRGCSMRITKEVIEHSDVAVVCLSQAYRDSSNCTKELEYLRQLQKPTIFLQMDNTKITDIYMPSENDLWFDFRTTDNNLEQKIVKRLEKLLFDNRNAILSTRRMLLKNCPECKTNNIIPAPEKFVTEFTSNLDRICFEPKKGCLHLTGEQGVGKTWFLSNYFQSKENQKQLLKKYNNRAVVFVNCKIWADELYLSKRDLRAQVVSAVLKQSHSCFKTYDSVEAFKAIKPIVVFDDVYHLTLIGVIFEEFTDKGIPCCFVTLKALSDVIEMSIGHVDYGHLQKWVRIKMQMGCPSLGSKRLLPNIANVLRPAQSPRLAKIARTFSDKLENFDGLSRIMDDSVSLNLIDVPVFKEYYRRPETEAKILKGIENTAGSSKRGLFLVGGTKGVGKTTTISTIFRHETISTRLLNLYNIHSVIWLNCYEWKDGFGSDDKNETEAFNQALLKGGRKLLEASSTLFFEKLNRNWMSVSEMLKYFQTRNHGILYVLDDVNHISILRHFRTNCPSMPCLAITHQPSVLLANENNQSNSSMLAPFNREDFVENPCIIVEMEDDEIFEMLETTFQLIDHLSQSFIERLVRICCGLPLIAKFIAGRFFDCNDYHFVFEEIYKGVSDKMHCVNFQRMEEVGEQIVFGLISTLDNELQELYYTLVIFNPSEPVSVHELMSLWSQNEGRTKAILTLLKEKSLLNQMSVSETEFFTINQMSHEILVKWKQKDVRPTPGLQKIREDLLERLSCRQLKLGSGSRRFQLPDVILAWLIKLFGSSKTNDDLFLKIFKKFKGKCCCSFESVEFSSDVENTSIIEEISGHYVGNDLGGKIATLLARCGELPLLKRLHQRMPLAISTVDKAYGTPIAFAAMNGHLEVVKFLDEADPSAISKIDNSGWTPLAYAASNGFLDIVSYLCRQDSTSASKPDIWGRTPLSLAVIRGHLKVVKFLHEHYPEVISSVDNEGWTNLALALNNSHLDVVIFVNKQDRTLITQIDKDGLTPLAREAVKGDLAIVKFLHSQNRTVLLQKNKEGCTPLTLAAKNNNLDVVMYLHKQNKPNIATTNNLGQTPLIVAAKEGHLAVVEYLYEQDSEALEKQDNDGFTALTHAAKCGHLEIVKFLQEQNRNSIFQVDNNGWTPFAHAAINNHLEIVKYLFEQDSSALAKPSKAGWTVFTMTVRNGHIDVVKYLYDQDRRAVSLFDKFGRSPLALASAQGHLEVVKFLYEKDRSAITKTDKDNLTPLALAAKVGHFNVVKFLIDKDKLALSKSAKVSYFVPLVLAGNNGHLEVVRYLHDQDNSACLKTDKNGCTPMALAAKNGQLAIVQFFHEQDPTAVSSLDKDGWSLLARLAGVSTLNVVQFVHDLDKTAVSKVDNNGWTPLARAAAQGQLDVVKFLYEQDRSAIMIANKDNWTPLTQAVNRGDLEVVRYLYDKNPNAISMVDNNKWTLLEIAADNGDLPVVRYLYERDNLAISKKDKDGYTPLARAAERDRIHVCRFLVANNKAALAKVDCEGWTPLARAAYFGHEDVVRFLHDQDTSVVNRADDDGWTPLARASGGECENVNVVKFLYEQNPSAASKKDNDGKTPLDRAKERGCDRIVDFLKGVE